MVGHINKTCLNVLCAGIHKIKNCRHASRACFKCGQLGHKIAQYPQNIQILVNTETLGYQDSTNLGFYYLGSYCSSSNSSDPHPRAIKDRQSAHSEPCLCNDSTRCADIQHHGIRYITSYICLCSHIFLIMVPLILSHLLCFCRNIICPVCHQNLICMLVPLLEMR